MEDSFYEELKRIFDKFLKYHMKILLGDLNAKVGRDDIFKPTVGNESLHEINNNISLSTVQCSHIAEFINILGRLQMGTPTVRLTIS
jgi:hypothetical protein